MSYMLSLLSHAQLLPGASSSSEQEVTEGERR